jgi:hypothetical protein
MIAGQTDATELTVADEFPILRFMRRHGRLVAAGSATTTFVLVATAGHGSVAGRVTRATALALAVGLGLVYMSELTEVVTETLLPQ